MRRERTTKCGPITSDMSWQNILVEFRKLNDDRGQVVSLLKEEGILIWCALFAEHTHNIVSRFPPGISEREYKERLYFARYGEQLPDDFFKDDEL